MEDIRFVFQHYRFHERTVPRKSTPEIIDKMTVRYGRDERGMKGFFSRLSPKRTWPGMPSPRGGKTTCRAVRKDGDDFITLAEGVAHCSVKDVFCYRIGREIAMGRCKKMLEQLGYKKESETEILNRV